MTLSSLTRQPFHKLSSTTTLVPQVSIIPETTSTTQFIVLVHLAGPSVLEFSVTAAPSPTYWPSHYSYSGLNTNYDPYLSPHYDFGQYYPTNAPTTNITTQDTLIDTPDAITSTTTNEGITFAEAFIALANFEPNIVAEESD